MLNEKQKKPFVSLRFIVRKLRKLVTAASLAQAIKAQNGAGLDLFCRDMGSIQSLSLLLLLFFFSFFSVSLAISQTKTVEAAKSNRLSSGRVEICLRKICS